MIQTHWLKKLTAFHDHLTAQVTELQGQTILIVKDPHKRTASSSYRLITCFSTAWKLLSGITTANYMYMSKAPKGITSITRE